VLALPTEWVWDNWLADDGETYHLFFLRAPKSLIDPEARHVEASIGHATSTDLRNWVDQGTILESARAKHRALWTGSVARGDDGPWRMCYTALLRNQDGKLPQRVEVAESVDLYHWTVLDRPIVEVDTRWYQAFDDEQRLSETWRDPFVFRDPDGDDWHMVITARVKGRPSNSDGALAHARSRDLATWEVGPPISQPGGFGQLEVPRIHLMDGRFLLVFSCLPEDQTAEQRQRFGEFATWSLSADSPLGPWDLEQARPFEAEPLLYAAPLVQDRSGGWNLLGFRNEPTTDGACLHVVDPIAVELVDGYLKLAQPNISST
jgi:beta-fructofuranosidase